MIEIILLAGAVSVELEPYAVENNEPDSHAQEIGADVSGRPFQWTTRQNKPGTSIHQGTSDLDSFGNRVERDGSEGSVEIAE